MLWTGVKSGLLISVLGKRCWFHLTNVITMVVLMRKWIGLFLRMLGLIFSSKLGWGSFSISISETASKKIRVLIRSIKFISPENALYLYKFAIHLCME